jgi:4a-hydroxytetrahydrobiopterin dehydratase
MRPSLLSEEDIQYNLNNLPLWERKDNLIFREIAASNFAAAVGIINAIAVLAETADHHPDLLIYGWNKVRISLSTHDRGGLTELDFALAKKIEDLKF